MSALLGHSAGIMTVPDIHHLDAVLGAAADCVSAKIAEAMQGASGLNT